MKLIIAEKPSLAKNIANAIKQIDSNMKYNNEYYESKNYIITSAFGHLLELATIEEYLEKDTIKWLIDDLPFMPENFKFIFKIKNDEGVKKRVNLLKKLIHNKQVDEVINCGDADREGEIIIRTILNYLDNEKPVTRLWLPDQTESGIINSLNNLSNDSEYDLLAAEGYTRMYLDWLYGINYSRYASIKANTTLHVGRVISPLIYTIYKRDLEIENFIALPYYQLVSKEFTNGEEIELIVKNKYDNKNDLNMKELLNQLNNNSSIVTNIEKKEKIIKNPKLFSQSDLQNVLSKKYKYSPSETLSICQSLYEKGYITYPRTPTNYLSTNEKDKVKEIIATFINDSDASPLHIEFKDSKRIFDDSKIESHSAIIPTNKLPNYDNLSEKEKNCWQAITNRFCATFCKEELKIAENTITINNSNVDFEIKGITVLSKGFLMFDESSYKRNETTLPDLSLGDEINSNFKIVEKMTTPPKHWTIETLNNYLKNPFRKKDDSEDEIYKKLLAGLEIGTEATRPGIIANAIKANYINLNKDIYTITSKGKNYIKTLEDLDINMSIDTSVTLSKNLKKVYKGETSINNVLSDVFDNIISNTINKNHNTSQNMKEQIKKERLGKCPRCKGDVYETPKSYTCESYSTCGFALWKNNKFLENAKKKLTTKMVKDLLKDNKTFVKGLTSPKKNTKYDAVLYIEDTGQYINIKPKF